MKQSLAGSAIGLYGPKCVALAVPLQGFLVRQRELAHVFFSLPRSLNGSVDSGTGDVEQLSELARGMRPCPMNFHQVTLLGCRQFRLLAAEVTFRFGHLHSLSRFGADEVGFELCHHRENVEQ